jgi:hypothetical protein
MLNRTLHRLIVGFLVFTASGLAQANSNYELKTGAALESAQQVKLILQVRDMSEPDRELPVRVIVAASDGSHPDGSGHGVYGDGRFYVHGGFDVTLPAGDTRIELSSGPNYTPLTIQETLLGGKTYHLTARLYQWFSPAAHGWYCGDNHVHALHDAHAQVKASLDYTALQGRANGLNWITEAGSNVPYDRIDRLDTDSFLLRYAQEQRPGAYVGHVNTPGISRALDRQRLDDMLNQPLPVQAIKGAVHALGGVVIHTHPLTPPHQLHWMGASEFFSDAVLRNSADLLDIDSRTAEWLWFMALNLGNRVGASASTDSALGRVRTRSPGDRRVYCQADAFTYPAIVQALRQGRTFASNGKGIFPFWEIDGRQPGDTIELQGSQRFTAQLKIYTRQGVRTAQLYRNGIRIKAFNLTGQAGPIELQAPIGESQTCWYVLRIEDQQGNWAITSPIYFQGEKNPEALQAEAILLEISNCTRFVELRREFYAHIITTVSPGEGLKLVELLRGKQVLKRFRPAEGDRLSNNRIPVTQLRGDYDKGWIWQARADKTVHFQADFPVEASGWYAVRVHTEAGRTITSDALRFDAAHPNSRALSLAHLNGADCSLKLLGYGEEMPLKDITLPFKGDNWWYPKNSFWQMTVDFGQGPHTLGGGWKKAQSNFQTAR